MIIKDVFTEIYNKRCWGFNWYGEQTVSGSGSTLIYTENLRKELPNLYDKFGFKTVLDAPCGDFNWMKHVVKKYPDMEYIGADIVKNIVKTNNDKYSSEKIKFIELDIVNDPLPKANLMICRDCLFHFSTDYIFKFLDNFLNSDIDYLLTTSFNDIENTNIHVGGFFRLNLFAAPFNFPTETLYSIEDWANHPINEGVPVRHMYLWSKEQLAMIKKPE